MNEQHRINKKANRQRRNNKNLTRAKVEMDKAEFNRNRELNDKPI
jgi:hypothetical protein